MAFDALSTDAATGDFVVPVLEANAARFFGLQSRKASTLGVMVYVGKEVTVNDLFAKLVDTGRNISDVDQTLSVLADYLRQLAEHRIGNVVAIEVTSEEPCGYRLKRVANTPSGVAEAT